MNYFCDLIEEQQLLHIQMAQESTSRRNVLDSLQISELILTTTFGIGTNLGLRTMFGDFYLHHVVKNLLFILVLNGDVVQACWHYLQAFTSCVITKHPADRCLAFFIFTRRLLGRGIWYPQVESGLLLYKFRQLPILIEKHMEVARNLLVA